MKKKVWITLLILAVVAVGTAAVLPGLLGGGRTLPEGAAAMYKDTVISEETVSYLENTYAQAGRTVSREEIIDDLLTDCAVEEASGRPIPISLRPGLWWTATVRTWGSL